MELADLPIWNPQQKLINVNINNVKIADTSEDSPIIITYTIEVGPPSLTLKGTFSQWFDPSVRWNAPSPNNNKPIEAPSNDFITYINACHLHFTRNMTLEELQDLIYEKLNNRLRYGNQPTAETRIKELEARLEAEDWYCCDMRREHHNNR